MGWVLTREGHLDLQRLRLWETGLAVKEEDPNLVIIIRLPWAQHTFRQGSKIPQDTFDILVYLTHKTYILSLLGCLTGNINYSTYVSSRKYILQSLSRPIPIDTGTLISGSSRVVSLAETERTMLRLQESKIPQKQHRRALYEKGRRTTNYKIP